MYAVIIEYWNGDRYSVDYDDIVVYVHKPAAEAEADRLRGIYKADANVNVVELEVAQ